MNKYMWIGRKVRHAHGSVGEKREAPIAWCDNHAGGDVGNARWRYENILEAKNDVHCKCGYAVCAQRGPCAPKPKDELPEGWKQDPDDVYTFVHVDGHAVRECCFNNGWLWWTAPIIPAARCDDPKPTRNEAMAAALASVEPAEPWGCVNRTISGARDCAESGHYWCDLWEAPAAPEPRPGWRLEDDGWSHVSGHHVYRTATGQYRLFGDSYHHTLEAAMLRAEELAGEP